MSGETQIYVRVALPGGGSAWRPARGARQDDDTWRIVSIDAGPGERPEFQAGDLVTCRPYELTDHDLVLVAHQRAGTGKEEP